MKKYSNYVFFNYLMADNTQNGAVVDPCLECGQTVRPRQEAIQCEECSFWQHRTCKQALHVSVIRELYEGKKK